MNVMSATVSFAEKFRLETSRTGLQQHVQGTNRWESNAASHKLGYVFLNVDDQVHRLAVHCTL